MQSMEIDVGASSILYEEKEPTVMPHIYIERLRLRGKDTLADRIQKEVENHGCPECGSTDLIFSLSVPRKSIYYGCPHCEGFVISKQWSGDRKKRAEESSE